MFTGFLTDIAPPDGWVEPEMCTAEEYSQCNTDGDCSLAISPSCDCYVISSFHPSWSFHPLSPCNELDPSDCIGDTCDGEECDEYEAMCSEGGTCLLSSIDNVRTVEDDDSSCSFFKITTCNKGDPNSCDMACGFEEDAIVNPPCQTHCHGSSDGEGILSCTIFRGDKTIFQCFEGTRHGRFLRGATQDHYDRFFE